MVEQILGGNIILVDFELDNQEMVVIKKIIGNYAKKINNIAEYQELKIVMKIHKKNKTTKYEMKIHLTTNGEMANVEVEGFNPFVLVNDALGKILREVEHKIRK